MNTILSKFHVRIVIFLACTIVVGCQYGITNPSAKKENLAKVANLNTELGFRYMQEMEFDLAYKKISKALSADPKHAEAHNAMGLLKNALGETKEAESFFLTAIRLNKENPATSNNYGQFLCQHGRYSEGKNYLLLAAGNPLNASKAAAYFNTGKCMRAANKDDEAEMYFLQALQLSPNDPLSLIEIANLKLLSAELVPAIEYFTKFKQLSTHNSFSLWFGFRLAVATNNKDDAASYKLLLNGMFPESEEAKLLDNYTDTR